MSANYPLKTDVESDIATAITNYDTNTVSATYATTQDISAFIIGTEVIDNIGSGQITNTMLSGSIPDSKLAEISSAGKVKGSAVQLATNTAIEDSTGLGLQLKSSIGDTGLTLTSESGVQKLSVDAIQSHITSIGQDGQVLTVSSNIMGKDASFVDIYVENQKEDGGVVYTDTTGKLLTESTFTYDSANDTLSVVNLNVSNLDIATGANFNNNDLSNVAIKSGSITGTNIDVSSGSLTTSASQNLAILEGAESNIDFGLFDISAQTVTSSSLVGGRIVFSNNSGTMVDSSGLVYDDLSGIMKTGKIQGLDVNESPLTNYIEFTEDNQIWFKGTLPRSNYTETIDDGIDVNSFILTRGLADSRYVKQSFEDSDGNTVTFDTDAYFTKNNKNSANIGSLYVEDITMYGSFITNDVSINTNLYIDNKLIVPRISGFTLEGAVDFSNQAMTNVKINSGSIDNTSVDVSDSTFTTSATQKLAILEGAGSDVHFGDYKISATMSEFTSIAGGNAVFTSIAEKLNTVGSESSNTIDYNDGSVVYLTLSGARPYTYDIINVPDLNAQTHVITVITKSSDINTDDYATSVTINGSSYDLIWNAGSLPELDTVVNDIITQQFSILPLDLVSSPGKVLTNVSYYKSAT